MKRDQMRMNAALGLVDSDEETDKLTPAEMQALMKKVRGKKEDGEEEKVETSGMGFDKAKVQIRAKPNANSINPHRL